VIEEAGMARVVIIGDVGGHPDQVRSALSHIGARGDRLELPGDVIVVQVGDLVDRGPDHGDVLRLVRGYLERQPHQWVQLVGNHEGQYLPGGTLFWPDPLARTDAQLLTSWWERGLMNVAAAVRTADGDDLLVTHAGPLWTEAGWELLEPWLAYHAAGGFVPFGQIHGHCAIVRYADRTWQCPGRVRQRATVDWTARHIRVRVGGRVFTGVDPKHGRAGAASWQPLVLADASLVSPLDATTNVSG